MKGQSCYLVFKNYAYAEWFPSKRKAMNTLPHIQAHFNIKTLEADDWFLSESYPWNFWRIRLDIYQLMETRGIAWKKHGRKYLKEWLLKKATE